MESETKKYEVLKDEILSKIEFVSKRSRNNKKKSFKLYILISIFSAIITLLVAVGDDIPYWDACKENRDFVLKSIILIFSGLSTVIAAWDGFYNHKQLWVNYRETGSKLKALELKLRLFSEEEKNDAKKLEWAYSEYQSILDTGNSKWKQLRLEDNDTNTNG